jgi:hypothetical protein
MRLHLDSLLEPPSPHCEPSGHTSAGGWDNIKDNNITTNLYMGLEILTVQQFLNINDSAQSSTAVTQFFFSLTDMYIYFLSHQTNTQANSHRLMCAMQHQHLMKYNA